MTEPTPVRADIARAILLDCADLIEHQIRAGKSNQDAEAFCQILRATAENVESRRGTRQQKHILFSGLWGFHRIVRPVYETRVDYLLHALWWGSMEHIRMHSVRHCPRTQAALKEEEKADE